MLFLLSLVLTCAVLTLALLNYPLYKRRKQCLDKIPGPKGLPLIGNLNEVRTTIGVYELVKQWNEEFGDLFRLKLGLKNVYLTTNPNLIQHVLNKNVANRKANRYKFTRGFLGDGLITLMHEATWQRHRKAVQPIFHIKLLEQFIGTFDKHASKLIQILDKEENKDCVEISRYTNLFALDIVCETIMGVDLNSQEYKNSAYVKAINFLTQNLVARVLSFMGQTDFTYSFTKAFKEERKQLNVVNSFIESVIKERRVKLNQNRNHCTLLDMLLLETTFTDEEIKDEVQTFMHAGHDTTGHTLNFALYCLSNHPFIQQKAYEEVCSILQTTNQCTYSDLNKLKYLENVIKETLRLYTTIPFVAREITEEFQYENNTFLKGSDILLHLHGAHLNPNNFTNPNKFQPERWNNDEKEAKLRPSNNIFLPFSAGPRNCIGQKYAMLELKCVLAKILLNYELLPSNPEKPQILALEVTIKSVNGIYIGLKKRLTNN